MRASIAEPRVAWLVLVIGCQPLPSEVTTEGLQGSSGMPSTTATSQGGDTSPASASSSADGTSSPGASAATASSGSADESSTGAPLDEPLGPFGRAELVLELSSPYSDDDPTLTGDMLELYFGSNRGGVSEDVWMSKRATLDAPWDPPVAVASVSSGSTESLVEVSADGLIMMVASDRFIFGDLDVYYTRRSDRGQPWPVPIVLSGAATPGSSDVGATPSPDLASVFLCRAPLGQTDVYEAPFDFAVPLVGAPVLVMELSSAQEDCSVSLSPGRREVFIESTRPTATLGWNLWTAMRDDPEATWDAPNPVAELNSDGDDIDPWLSPDRLTLWFASNRSGQYELYVATRT